MTRAVRGRALGLWPAKTTVVDNRMAAGPLLRVALPRSRSRILARSRGLVWVFNLPGRKGTFSKEHEESRQLGRNLCDAVIKEFDCGGFLTTDELPRYGFSWDDRDTLFRAYSGADPDRDVLVVLAYDDRNLAEEIREYIVNELSGSKHAKLA